MKKINGIVLVFSALCILYVVFSSFSKEKQNIDVIILKLMGKDLESAYIINDGKEMKVRAGLTGDDALAAINTGVDLKGIKTFLTSSLIAFFFIYNFQSKGLI